MTVRGSSGTASRSVHYVRVDAMKSVTLPHEGRKSCGSAQNWRRWRDLRVYFKKDLGLDVWSSMRRATGTFGKAESAPTDSRVERANWRTC